MLSFQALYDNHSPELKDLQLLQTREFADDKISTKIISRVQPGYFYILAYHGKKPVAYAECAHERKRLVVYSFYTHSALERRGIFTNLVRFLSYTAHQQKRTLWIPNATERVQKLIERMEKVAHDPGVPRFADHVLRARINEKHGTVLLRPRRIRTK